MIYKGFQITAHALANVQYALDDDGDIAEFLAVEQLYEVEMFAAVNADTRLTAPNLAQLKATVDATIIPQPPAHAHGNTYYRSLYLREADKVAVLQKTVDTFANRVIVAETELAIVRDQLAQLRTGRDL